MKFITLSLCTVALLAFKSLPKEPKNAHRTNVFDASIQVSEEEFNTLTSAYVAFDTKATLGGAFDKDDLKKILNDMGNETYVRIRFAIDESGYISLMLKGHHRNVFDDVEYRRNTGSAASFCPAVCDMPVSAAASNLSASFHQSEWDNLSMTFQQQYPGKCQGGKIHRDALNEVVNSIPDNETGVNFRFCNDGGNVSVIFIGGNSGAGKVMYRNTTYCPTMCD